MNTTRITPLHRKSSGFTLIELLVVIAIIALLVAGLTGQFGKIFGNAKKKETEVVCASIANAIEKYFQETDFLPAVTNNGSADVEFDTGDGANGLVDILVGKSADSKTNYLEGMKQAKQDKGMYVNGIQLEDGEAKIFDSWGNAYKVVMNYNGAAIGEEGGITNPNDKSKMTKVRKRVLVYSAGADKKYETWVDNVKSWDDGE